MLTVLTPIRARRRYFRRRKGQVTQYIIPAGSGAMRQLTAEILPNGQLNWEAVAKAAGEDAGHLLLPRGMSLPDGYGLAEFNGQALTYRLMGITAIAILRELSLDPRLVGVRVYDRRALLPNLPMAFLPYASDIRVITHYPHLYDGQKYTAMTDYGAVLSVFTDPAHMGGGLLTLAPEGIPFGLCKNGICLSGISVVNCNSTVHGYIPPVSDTLLKLLPDAYDQYKLLAGLYERSGIREIAAEAPHTVFMDGKAIDIRQAAVKITGINISQIS